MKNSNFYNRGQSLIGIIIVLIVAGLISGGLYYYFLKQIPEVPEITKKAVEEKTIKPEEKPTTTPEITCQDECFSLHLTKCAGKDFQVCGYYDEDNCLEWGPVINCPVNTICQNGSCVQSTTPTPEVVTPTPELEKPVVQRCTDGTLYAQCAVNKPLYCQSGVLINKCSACSCPPNQICQADGSCKIAVQDQKEKYVFIIEDEDGKLYSGDSVHQYDLLKKFYEKYPDQYDFIGFFFSKGIAGGLTYAYTYNRPVKGSFSSSLFTYKFTLGSKQYRILGGYMDTFNFDDTHVERSPNSSPVDLIDNYYFRLLFHELTHYWGVSLPEALKEAVVHYPKGPSRPTEYTDNTHWESFTGSWIASLPTTRKKVIESPEGKYYFQVNCESEPKHHDFDLYSMGLKSSEEIKQKLIAVTYPGLIEKQDLCGTREIPAEFIERVFTIQDMINVLGPRIPSVAEAQKDFNIAFVLIIPRGTTATQKEIDALNWIADKFPVAWYKSTEGRSTLNGIKPKDTIPPIISNVKTSATNLSLTITWTTNEPTASFVIYTAEGGAFSYIYPNIVTNPPKFSTNHNIILVSSDWTPISPDVEYSVQVISIDRDYNLSSFDAGKIRTAK